MPAVALATEASQGVGNFCPGYGIGDEGDSVPTVVLTELAVHAGGEFHVLSHGFVGVTTGGDEVRAAEHAEGSRDDQQAIQLAPCGAGRDEGAQILDYLEVGERLSGRLYRHDTPLLELAAVGDPDDTAYGGDLAGLYHRAGDPQEGVLLEYDVGVHAADQRMAGGADAGVQGIGLTAVLLVNDDQALRGGGVDPAQGSRLQLQADRLVGLVEVELFRQYLQSAVLGAIVYDHYFV